MGGKRPGQTPVRDLAMTLEGLEQTSAFKRCVITIDGNRKSGEANSPV